MDWNSFAPYSATIGGLLIGLSASLLLLLNGKICGISGILGRTLVPRRGDVAWRLFFLLGLAAGAFATFSLYPPSAAFELDAPTWLLAVAGLFVGYGTRLGNGCTSGHGVCGIPRFSRRSIVATLVFMGAGIITAYLTRHVLGVAT